MLEEAQNGETEAETTEEVAEAIPEEENSEE